MQCFVFALIYVGYGTNWAIFKDLSYGGKGSGNPCWLCSRTFLRAYPLAITGFLVECFSWRFWAHFCCLCIFSAVAGFIGVLLWGAWHMVKRSCFARRHNGSHAASSQSKVICASLCFEGDPTCNHDSISYQTWLQRTRNVNLAGESPVGDTTSVILDSSNTLVASCTST